MPARDHTPQQGASSPHGFALSNTWTPGHDPVPEDKQGLRAEGYQLRREMFFSHNKGQQSRSLSKRALF